jgi:phage terminase small subunit
MVMCATCKDTIARHAPCLQSVHKGSVVLGVEYAARMLKQATVSLTALEAAEEKVWQSSKEVEGQLTQQLDRLQATREAALCKVNAMFDELAASLGEAAKTKTEALTSQAQGLEREVEALDKAQAIEGMDEQARLAVASSHATVLGCQLS